MFYTEHFINLELHKIDKSILSTVCFGEAKMLSTVIDTQLREFLQQFRLPAVTANDLVIKPLEPSLYVT